MSNALTIQSFERDLAMYKKQISSVLPAHIKPERFMRTVVGAIQNSPGILECDKQSILLSCQRAAQDGLMLDGKEAALVPFNTKVGNSWVKMASYQPMIDGILKKARNSGQLSVINAITVHEEDSFKYNPAVDDLPNHNPNWFGDRGKMIGVYAFAKMKDGSTAVEIMNIEQIEQVRKVSKQGSDDKGNPKGIWATWYDQKAKVACLKRLCRRLPSSTDLIEMFDRDNEENFDLSLAEESTEKEVKEPKTQTKAAALIKGKKAEPKKAKPKEDEAIEGELVGAEYDEANPPPIDDDDII